jgi:hypothetical protein
MNMQWNKLYDLSHSTSATTLASGRTKPPTLSRKTFAPACLVQGKGVVPIIIDRGAPVTAMILMRRTERRRSKISPYLSEPRAFEKNVCSTAQNWIMQTVAYLPDVDFR